MATPDRTRIGAIVIALIMSGGTGCSPSPRDVVPESRDVRVTPDGGVTTPSETYVYVARRPHGIVGLAEARHMKDDEARSLVDRIADELERCATNLDAQGLLVDGAARVVAIASASGAPALNVRFAPGDAVAQNALLCLVAPIRATPFPPATQPNAPPGLAIEATWGRKAQGPAPTGVDASTPM